MTRIGMNPARLKTSTYRPQRVTVAVLVHLPHFAGYHEHRLPIVKTCLETLIAHTRVPYDILVFDNASVPEVGDLLASLMAKGAIQFLIKSRANIGKRAALRMIFDAAPGELVAYTDDDFYFYPSWLEEQIALIDTYPNVGMVSGYAIPSLFAEARISSTLDFARSTNGAELTSGKFIPVEWIHAWATSTGRVPDQAATEFENMEEYVVKYLGVEAFATANHDQFLAPKAVIQGLLREAWTGRLMGEMLELDEAVNQAGYLRLTTRKQTTQHLGNTLSSELAARLPGLERRGETIEVRRKAGESLRKRFLYSWPVRSLLLGVYSRLFRLVHPD